MKLVVSSLIHRERPLTEALSKIIGLDIKRVELCVDAIHSNANNWQLSPEETLKNIRKIGVFINSIHIPLPTNNAHDPPNQIMKNSLDESMAALDLAAFLSAHYVVQHVELDHSDSSTSPKILDHVIPDLKLVANYAQTLGIKLALENVPSKNGSTMLGDDPYDVMRAVIALNSETVGMCLDVSHCVASGHDPVKIIQGLNIDKLLSLHISDNSFDWPEDRHLPIGQGQINWSELFDLLNKKGFEGCIVVEVAGDNRNQQNLRDSLKYLESFSSYFDESTFKGLA